LRFPGRVAAAIEILTEVTTRHRPASEALKDWGKAHRFAGSTDRHFIGTLVYDSLRCKSSAAHAMQSDTPKGIVTGVLKTLWNIRPDDILALAEDQHGPGAFSEVEVAALKAEHISTAPHVAGNFPEWLSGSLANQFGDALTAEMQALSSRAPVDLRVNSLKANRDQVIEALSRFAAVAGPLIASSVRIAAPGPEDRHANVEVEPAHGMGWFEVQDTASQIAAAMSGVVAGESVVDLCAGAGGKTLALASLMNNSGKLIAHDRDRHRLRPIFERMTRAGVSIVGFDCVVLDAPCSGSGAWRRKPESKWKLTPKLLDQRIADQRAVLEQGAALVKPGGRLVYITCSILPQENTEQIVWFKSRNNGFDVIPYTEQWRATVGGDPVASLAGDGLLLTPRSHNTDGFFVTVMRKR
jgi:16S rRNA (cytosine967-C5)-methyltransferase